MARTAWPSFTTNTGMIRNGKNQSTPFAPKKRSILIYEGVTGGGLAGQPLPPSWAAEGHAMRRAIAGDFASLGDVQVVMTLDARFEQENGPWTVVPVNPGEESQTLLRLAAEVDYT